MITTDFKADPTPLPISSVPIVKARVIDQSALDAEAERLRQIEKKKRREADQKRRAEEKKAQALRDEKAKLERQKKAEKKRIADEKKKLEVEKQRLAKQQAEERAERKRLDKEREKAAAEKQRLEEIENKRVAEAERLEAAKKTREEAARAAALAEALASEEAEREQEIRERADEEEIARYIAAVRTRVARVFIYPDLATGLSCTLYVRMIPGGEVVEARVISSSGDASFDRQAENAVRKAAPLPVPSDPRLFQRMREIKFVFDPEQ